MQCFAALHSEWALEMGERPPASFSLPDFCPILPSPSPHLTFTQKIHNIVCPPRIVLVSEILFLLSAT